MMAVDPETGRKQYFLDKNLPFGHSISCSLFQKISDAFKHIFEWKTHRGFATWKIIFLGITLNGKDLQFEIPEDKRIRTINMLNHFIDRKKVTVVEIQRLAGLLNFLNKAIVPGRAFQRRMYSKYSNLTKGKNRNATQEIGSGSQLKPYHHINLDSEFRQDCKVWLSFLDKEPEWAVNRPFSDVAEKLQADLLDFYTDASGRIGFGCYYSDRWIFSPWEKDYISNYQPSIAYLELYALCIGVFAWGSRIWNRRVIVHCDNQSVVNIINSTGSKCKNSMFLIKQLALNNLRFGTRVFAQYIETDRNVLADSLSRLDFKCFFKHTPPTVSQLPDELPHHLWPASKIWIK